MGTITYNDVWYNARCIAFFDASTTTYTQRGSTGNAYNCDLFPDTGVAVGDAIVFASYHSSSGKFNELKMNIGTALAATGITGVWEYSSGGTNSTPNWTALSGVTDGTNAFQNTGEQTVTFDVPDDWSNFHLTPVGDWIYYCFLVRFRITSISGLTEGGAISNVSNSTQVLGKTIHVSGFTSGAPCTFQDIYNADVAGSWGVVTKSKNQYSFYCNLSSDSGNYIETKREQIQFLTNYFFLGDTSSVLLSGEVYSGDKTRYGSSIIFNGYQVNYPISLVIAGVNSKLYNTTIRCIPDGTFANMNGYWSGGIGRYDGQEVYDVYIEGFRHASFNNPDNTIIGLTGVNNGMSGMHCETPGAIIKGCTFYGGGYSFRLLSSVSRNNDYIHECDLSGATYPINPYNSTNLSFFRLNCVDCFWGTVPDANRARWRNSGSPDTDGDHAVDEIYSMLIRAVDSGGKAVEGASLELKNVNNDVVFEVTSNIDGYFGTEEGTVTGVSSSYIIDSSKSWSTDEFWFKEIYMTSGDVLGARRIIKKGNTSTQLDMGWEFDTVPSISDRFIVIPYFISRRMTPSSFLSGYSLSDIEDFSPFTVTIRKEGYKPYIWQGDITNKVDWKVTLENLSRLRQIKQ